MVGFGEAVIGGASGGILLLLVGTIAHKTPKGPHKGGIQGFDAKNDVQVFGGAKGQSGISHEHIAGGPANKRIPVAVSGEMIPE